ncbi:MAG: very short patch repair endonuclease [Candidatus Hinthialibacter antarcticus]|nr:very short patch repair endonuclease [Candidatus Hinthialibacter antarcticus]
MDNLTPTQRRKTMQRVRSKDTKPEMIVRRLAHSLGFRFRLHRADLPGKPDLAFPRLRKVIFVHGCFWHSHRCKHGRRRPQSNQEYWTAKLDRNKQRDQKHRRALKRLGWSVLVVWECQLSDYDTLQSRISDFLAD